MSVSQQPAFYNKPSVLHVSTFDNLRSTERQTITLPLIPNNIFSPLNSFTFKESSPLHIARKPPSTLSTEATSISNDTAKPRRSSDFACDMDLSSLERLDTTTVRDVPQKTVLPRPHLTSSSMTTFIEAGSLSKAPSDISVDEYPLQPNLPCYSNSSETHRSLPAITNTDTEATRNFKTAAPMHSVHNSNPQRQYPVKMEQLPLQQPTEHPTLWVFGYGSLMWKTDFTYRSKKIGFIKGYERRFYLGNTTYRGCPGQPGRVANLVEVENGQTWGVAFEVHGEEEVAKVLKNLYAREVVSGGYLVMTANFYPRESDTRRTARASNSTDSLSSLVDDEDTSPEPTPNFRGNSVPGEKSERADPESIQVILFTVTEKSEFYLGPDDVDSMASQIVRAKGSAGTNVEYVTKTADFVRMHIPEDEDSHLFQLDAKVRELVYKAQARDAERVRLGLSDIAHDLHETSYDHPQATVVKAS